MVKDEGGRYVVDLSESAAIIVEQIEAEITVTTSSIVGVDFQETVDKAMDLSRALTAAGKNASAGTASSR
jgi:hypothetical protein